MPLTLSSSASSPPANPASSTTFSSSVNTRMSSPSAAAPTRKIFSLPSTSFVKKASNSAKPIAAAISPITARQIVGYPILNLDRHRRDVHWYVRTLEEAMIRASADFGVAAYRIPGKTGIWVQPPGDIPDEKLAAIGVHISRWVTSHGFAYNVSTDLRFFDLIIPCGIADRKATSLEKLLHHNVSLDEVRPPLAHYLAELFSLTPQLISKAELFARLDQFESSVK